MQEQDWHFDIVPKKHDDKYGALGSKSQEDWTDQFGIWAAIAVLCVALLIAAVWFTTTPSFEKCSVLQNKAERDVCYGELRKDLFKPPAKGAYF